MGRHDNIVCISPATEYGSNLEQIFKDFKNRSFDVGIGEEHSLIFANGLALDNIHPYVFIYSSFLQRAYDELIHDVARMDTNVTIMVDHAGLVGKDGATHQGIYDTSFLFGIPNITVAMAKDENDARKLFKFSLTYKKPLLIRYNTTLIDIDTKNDAEVKDLKYLEYETILQNNDKNQDSIALLSYGPHLDDIYKQLSASTSLKIVNTLFLYPINKEYLKTLLDYQAIIIYDPYSTEPGYTSLLVNALSDLNYKGQTIKKTIKTKFICNATIEEQEKDNEVDVGSLIDLIKGLNKNER